jgi:hypothetical protein
MPNPQVVIGNNFKDHTAFPIAAFVQPLPSKHAILPSPIHAIDVAKDTWKSPRCILCKDSGCVFFSWLSQIVEANTSTIAQQNLKTPSVDVNSAIQR